MSTERSASTYHSMSLGTTIGLGEGVLPNHPLRIHWPSSRVHTSNFIGELNVPSGVLAGWSLSRLKHPGRTAKTTNHPTASTYHSDLPYRSTVISISLQKKE
ncbi:MAG: hypothetical protein GY809_06140 [Planctomycetes bacterium]|nr:hypothetical protein [Planctomycetota bacterium]